MINLEAIKAFYPDQLHAHGAFLIREYLQHKILEIIYNTQYAQKLVFMGDTFLRIIHNNQRFSEDLDFDNKGLNKEDFNDISDQIARNLELEGYEVEMKVVQKNAFHCCIKFPKLLYKEGLSGYQQQKILIQLDTEPQPFDYVPETTLLNKFDVFTEIFTAPLSLLLAQKFYALLNMKRNKGRDFFDIAFLISLKVEPDYSYLFQKLDISTKAQLKKNVLAKCSSLDLKEMALDVAPFLFSDKDVKKIEMFDRLVEQEL